MVLIGGIMFWIMVIVAFWPRPSPSRSPVYMNDDESCRRAAHLVRACGTDELADVFSRIIYGVRDLPERDISPVGDGGDFRPCLG